MLTFLVTRKEPLQSSSSCCFLRFSSSSACILSLSSNCRRVTFGSSSNFGLTMLCVETSDVSTGSVIKADCPESVASVPAESPKICWHLSWPNITNDKLFDAASTCFRVDQPALDCPAAYTVGSEDPCPARPPGFISPFFRSIPQLRSRDTGHGHAVRREQGRGCPGSRSEAMKAGGSEGTLAQDSEGTKVQGGGAVRVRRRRPGGVRNLATSSKMTEGPDACLEST